MAELDEKLVNEWRRSRDPRIVAEFRKRLVVEARRALRRAPREGNLDVAWAAAVEQKNFQRLLDLILSGTLNRVAQKVMALSELDDPRVILVLQPAMAALGPQAREELLPAVIEVLGRSNDVSCRSYVEHWRSEEPGRVEAALARLDQVKVTPVADLDALMNPRPQREADLFAAVYRNPEDQNARAVLADALQERGDPRGEFISLQLGPDSAASRVRAEALQAQHKREWISPLRLNLSQSDQAKVQLFDRGFLHTAVVDGLEDQEHLREWATVAHLFADRAEVNQPAMRKLAQTSSSLRSLFWLDLESAAQLVSAQLENVGVWCEGNLEKKHLAGLTGLRALWLMPSAGFLRATLPWDRLERVFLYDGDASWTAWLEQVRVRSDGPLVQVSLLEARAQLPELTGWELRFRVDADPELRKPELIWHGAGGVRSPAALADSLVRQFDSVTVRAPPDGVALVKDRLGSKLVNGRYTWHSRESAFERLMKEFPP